MLESELRTLVNKIIDCKTEYQTVEVKCANKGCTEKLYDTLSSFSNQDDGGIIVFGIDEKNGFSVAGVYDPNDLQKKVTAQCESMQPVVRAVFTVADYDGKYVVSAEIPPVDITERPCFYLPKGRIKGSYVRVGDADNPMNEYEVYSYEAFRKKYRDDIKTVESADENTLDVNAVTGYVLKLKADKPNLARLDDSQVLSLMSILKNGKPTIASLLLFGLYPQAFFPQLSIVAMSVPGTEVGDVSDDGARFVDNKRIEGTIPEMLDSALLFVRNNMRTRVIIDSETGKRTDKTDYPMNAVREAVLNALVHRDYSIHTEGMPIQIIMFSDRMEIRSPGGLYGRLTVDTLGKIQADTRNPVLATALEVLGVTENRYSGIPTIIREMKEMGLPEPEFVDRSGEFKVIFYKSTPENKAGNVKEENELVSFCRIPRTKKEIAVFLGVKTETYAIKKYVQPLVNCGKIKLTLPKTPSSPNQKYYS